MSRHMACKNCRDRKVKCDGNQPVCEKCNRSGEDCMYVRSFTPTKGDVLQTIENLQERLAKAEAQLQEQRSEANRNVTLTNPYSPTMLNYNSAEDLQGSFTGIPSRTPMFQPNSDFRNLGQAYNDSEDSSELFRSLQNSPQSMRNHIHQQEGVAMMTPCNNSLPSLNELRAMNSRAGNNITITPNMSRSWEDDDSRSITAPVLEFLSSIFDIQADITGVSSAVAEYLAWVGKSPGKAENSGVLAILEARARELNQMASSRHWAALKHMISQTEKGDTFHTQLKQVEKTIVDKTMKTAQFFHDEYHIGSGLSQQRQE